MSPALLTHDGPSTLVATLNEQGAMNRYVLHLLHYIPVKSSEELYTIEDVIPLYNVTVKLRAPRPIKAARAVPGGEPIDSFIEGEQTCVTAPCINGHLMIELAY